MDLLLNKYNNIKLPLVILFIIFYVTFYNIITMDRDKRIDLELQNNLHDLTVHHNLTLDYFYTDAKSIQSKVVNDPKILELVKNSYQKPLEDIAGNRDELYNYLLPFYERIKTRGVLQFQFMFPDNKTFLRMHKPEKFNDDLSEIRYSYKNTNKTKKINYGFEHGRTSHSIRYVFPLFDKDNNHIGASEVALSTNYIQYRLVNTNKLYTHYIVNKKILDVRAWKAQGVPTKYLPSVEHDDYVFAADSLNNESKHLQQEKAYIAEKKPYIAKMVQTEKPFSLYIPQKHNVKVISFVPVKNIKDKKVSAYIVSHSDSKKIQTVLEDSKKILVTGFVVFLIFFYFLFKLLINRESLQDEVKKKTYELQQLNDNLKEKVKKEVAKNKKAQEQIHKSEKLAALGEMIGNIAHQWRQPLSVISTAISGLKMEKEYGQVTDEKIEKAYLLINDNAQYLSKTIDDFRDFIQDNREKKKFILNDTVNSFLHLVEGSIKNHNLDVVVDLEDNIEIMGYPNELTQCFLNLFNNAKDAQVEQEKERLILIQGSVKKDTLIITIKDNGGGIPEEIITRIFEPYFTTKHKSQGTGLGLSMTYNIITNGMGGSIEASNTSFKFREKSYKGAKIKITLPIK